MEASGGVVGTAVDMAREAWLFVVSPREIVRRRRNDWSRPASPWVVLGWSVAGAIVLAAAYGWIFGFSDGPGGPGVSGGVEAGEAPVVGPSSRAPEAGPEVVPGFPDGPPDGRARLSELGLSSSFGIFLSTEPAGTEPLDGSYEGTGRLTLQAGFVRMSLSNVDTEGLGQGAFPLVMAVALAVVIVLCVYPPARLLGARTGFGTTLRLSALFCAYALLGTVVVVLVSLVILYRGLGLRETSYEVASTVVGDLPLLALLARGYGASFAELFGFSLKRLSLAALLGVALSVVLYPLVLLPAAYLAIRLRPFLDLVL